jgi:hypothetical protein
MGILDGVGCMEMQKLLGDIEKMLAMCVLDLFATRKRYPSAMNFEKWLTASQLDFEAIPRDREHLFLKDQCLWLR